MPGKTQQNGLFEKTYFTVNRGPEILMRDAIKRMSGLIGVLEPKNEDIINKNFFLTRRSLVPMKTRLDNVLTEGTSNVNALTEWFMKNWKEVQRLWEEYKKDFLENADEKNEEEKNAFEYIRVRMEALETDLEQAISLFSGMSEFDRFLDSCSAGKEKENMLETAELMGLTGHRPSIHECIAMQPERMSALQILDRFLWLSQHTRDFDDTEDKKPKAERKLHENSVYGYASRRMEAYIDHCDPIKLEELAETYFRLKMGLYMKAEQKYAQILEGIPNGPDKEDRALIMLSETPEFIAYQTANAMINKFGTVFKVYVQNLTTRSKNENKDVLGSYRVLNAEAYNGHEGPVERAEAKLDKYSSNKDPEKAAIGVETRNRILAAAGARIEEAGGAENIRSRIAETYYHVMRDKREASESFNGMRRALYATLNRTPEDEKDPMAFFGKLTEAQRKVQEYLDSHKRYRFTDQGKERVAWAKELKEQLEEYRNSPSVVKLSENYRQQKIDKAVMRIRNYLAAMESKDNRLDHPERLIRDAYAEILYQQMKLQGHKLLDAQTEEAEFERFLESKAVAAAFAGRDVYSMKRLVAPAVLPEEQAAAAQAKADREKLMENLQQDFRRLKEHAFLDKIPGEKNAPHGQIVDKFLALKQTEAFTRNDQVKSLFFENFTDSEKTVHIKEIEENENRLELSANRSAYVTLALGVLLEDPDRTFDQAIDIYGSHQARIDAGKELLKKHAELDDEAFAAYCGQKLHTVLEVLTDYVDAAVMEMGEVTLDKMTDPRYKNLGTAITFLQDAAQEAKHPMIREWLNKNRPDITALIEKQKCIGSTIGQIKPDNIVKEAVCCDVHANIPWKRVNEEMLSKDLNSYVVCGLINEALKKNPGKKLTEVALPDSPLLAKTANATVYIMDPVEQARAQYSKLNQKGALGSFAQALIHNVVPDSFAITTTIDKNNIVDMKMAGFEDLIKHAVNASSALQKKIDKKQEKTQEVEVIREYAQEALKAPVIGR